MEEYRYLQYITINSRGKFKFFIDSANRWFIFMDVEVLLDNGETKVVRCFLPNPSGGEKITNASATPERITIVLQHVLSQNLDSDEVERYRAIKELEDLYKKYTTLQYDAPHYDIDGVPLVMV